MDCYCAEPGAGIVTLARAESTTAIWMDLFSAAALWWTLTEGFFLLKSLANFVKIANALMAAGVTFPWTVFFFGLILIYDCGIFIYLAFQLITSYGCDDNICGEEMWLKYLE